MSKHVTNRQERICPFCGETYTKHPAVSRVDNKTCICPECGVEEALIDFFLGPERLKLNYDSKMNRV